LLHCHEARLNDLLAHGPAPVALGDREQDHMSLRWHAVEEVYELLDAIEAGTTTNWKRNWETLLLQVVFHCQLARERGAFDFEKVARHITDKLIRRHPHVFGNLRVKDVDQVWANWEKIKRAEKHGTRHARPSALDGIPKRLPALLQAAKLVKRAHKAKLMAAASGQPVRTRKELAERLFALAQFAQERGWSAEDCLRSEIKRRERMLRARRSATPSACEGQAGGQDQRQPDQPLDNAAVSTHQARERFPINMHPSLLRAWRGFAVTSVKGEDRHRLGTSRWWPHVLLFDT
jgi:NTP pyrophosphatase (non-canonical NTP hydrolase)